MAEYILDTDTCIYWLKGNRNIERRALVAGLGNVRITVITECELYYGAYKSARMEQNLAALDVLRRKIRTIHTTPEVPRLYGEIKTPLERKGEILDDADLLIACITLTARAILVTNNTKHFNRIPNLRLENWS